MTVLDILSTENGKSDKKASTGQIPEATKISTGQYPWRENLHRPRGPRKGNQPARVAQRPHRRSWIPVWWRCRRGGEEVPEKRCRRGEEELPEGRCRRGGREEKGAGEEAGRRVPNRPVLAKAAGHYS